MLSPMAGMCLAELEGKCGHHGIAIGHHERLTNIMYAHDLMLDACSFPVLVEMIETFSCKLSQVGLHLKAAKNEMFTTKLLDHPMFAEVSQGLVHVLHGGSARKYLCKRIPGNLKQRGRVELHHRVTNVWAKFDKHNQTCEFETAIEIFQCRCHANHCFGLHTLALTRV